MSETDSTPGGGDSLRILLVEDNPGDARYIRELVEGATELSERAISRDGGAAIERREGDPRDEPTLVHETRLAGGLERLAGERVDVVLLDLNLPDSDGLETVETVRKHDDSVPIVVLTGLRDRKTGLEALRRGAEEYLVKDEINRGLLIRSTFHAIERKAQERELERQRNRLSALHSLNELVHEITHLVIESSTREEIERLVCEHLADSESYLFAWAGEVGRDNETATMRTEAGVENYLDGTTIELDGSEGGEPIGRAVRTREVEVARVFPENPDGGPWREYAEEHGFRSAAAIPIGYEETLYGVLCVYSERQDAFDADERAVIGRLGDVIGHAINAIERKQALMSEEVIELRLHIEDMLGAFGVRSAGEGTITFDRAIPVSEEVFLEYGTVTEEAVETLQALVEEVPHFESVSFLTEDRGARRFELRLDEPPAMSAVASYGGLVDSAVISGGDYRMVVHVPPGADVARLVEIIQAEYPRAEVIAQRTTTRADRSAASLDSALGEDLTEKQRAALESAYFAGFFEWPRESTGEEIAESLGVSASTFHQHVRTAERKLLRALLDPEDASVSR